MTTHRDALAFLIWRSFANRLRRQATRLRSPRYSLAFIAGAAYLWFALIGHSSWSAPTSTPTAFVDVAAIGFAITVVVWWLGKGAYLALAFRPAEAQFLFPAPVSRRALLIYKLVRSQVLILLNAVVWTLIVRRWGVMLPPPLRAATAWGYFTVLSLHRLGVALVQTRPLTGARRIARTAGAGLAMAVIAALVVGVLPIVLQLGRAGFPATMRAVGRALAEPPASYAMAPFRLIVAPAFAPTVDAWVRAFAVVLGIVALHVAWILAMRVEFEEEATIASEALARRIAAFRDRRAGRATMTVARKPRVPRDWLPLSPSGPPALAIAWKNTIALARTGSLRSLVFAALTITVFSRIVSAGAPMRSGVALSAPYLMIVGMTLILGPRVLRNDLRQDMLSISLLRSYPLRGRDVVAAELLSPTLVLTAFQVLMLVLAYAALAGDYEWLRMRAVLVALVLLVPLALAALNAIGLAMQNGAALLFPGWVRLGPDSGGVEAMGQTLLVMVGATAALLLALILPAVVGLAAFFVSGPNPGVLAVALGAAGAIAVLGAEIAGLIYALGGVFERTEPTAIE